MSKPSGPPKASLTRVEMRPLGGGKWCVELVTVTGERTTKPLEASVSLIVARERLQNELERELRERQELPEAGL